MSNFKVYDTTSKLSVCMRVRKCADHIETGECGRSNLEHKELDAWIAYAEHLENLLVLNEDALGLAFDIIHDEDSTDVEMVDKCGIFLDKYALVIAAEQINIIK